MTDTACAATMTGAAADFLDALDGDQRAVATVPFADTSARHDWDYVPRERGGLSFRAMSSDQEQRAYRLVATGLSLPTFAAVTTIVGLEDVLDRLEGGRRGRHRADYSITVFDEPGSAIWGWRFEGHHVSVNVTLVDGAITGTPFFLGSNPAEVLASSGAVVVRPLGPEEDLAIELIGAMDGRRRAEALLTRDVPAEILTTNAPTLDELPAAAGVRIADLDGSARAAAEGLVRHYIDRLPSADAESRWRRVSTDLGDVRFGFAGDDEAWSPVRAVRRRRPQYYRLAGPAVFVEYDNTQDDANHIHSVLRDPGGDFGVDLLRAHRARHH